ncbi:hypothetical protein [Halosimplex pelagicum]|uniref:Uncharacterized protein n=1 Tax=Halosimplex pelagicum TaxID=869886 RepID=A0A7D5TES6_9EURY|nr:hypothetical protein [Halosimplex pelagicum]QLH84035.1 hypothetical protein HZS54_21400 [Halosimplex pelagicum]
MIGTDPFCPESGAPLSRDRHYDELGRGKRAVTTTDRSAAAGTAGELTNGAVRSARTALLTYFERCHQRHGDADDELYRRGSVALRRLKSAASGRQEWDVHVWFALKHRLASAEYDVEWMNDHATLRCPHCAGRLRYRRTPGGVVATCGVDCDGSGGDALAAIRETVASLYAAAFDADPPETDALLQF